MSRVTDILAGARLILSDKNSDRWADADLLLVLNEGLRFFVLQTNSLKRKSYITIENNVTTYDLSDYAINISRIQYMSEVLATRSKAEMDRWQAAWETHTGTKVTTAVFDDTKMGVFSTYPIVEAGMADVFTQNNFYGGLIDISSTDTLNALPVGSILDTDIPKYLLVYYTGKPATVVIGTVDAALDLDSTYDAALVAYISGQLLRFDQDTLNRQLGIDQVKIFDSYLAKAMGKEGSNNNNFELHTVDYRRF